MPQQLFWYDPHEDVIYRTKEEYVKALKELAWNRFCERHADKVADCLGSIIAKKQDQCKTSAEVEAVVNEYWRLAYDVVMWRHYRSPTKADVVMDFAITPNRIFISGGEPYVHFDIKVGLTYENDNTSIFGLYCHIIQTLGFCINRYSECTAGKWHLLNLPAKEEYKKQYAAWEYAESSEEVTARLKAVPYIPKPFTFKGTTYAESPSMAM